MTEIKMQLVDWLDDLCVRFIINLPQEELASVERICFQVEEAQWFYEDFIRPQDPDLPSLNLKNFCVRIFQHCPLLLSGVSSERHATAFSDFLAYKTRVPVRGAIMLNQDMDQVVLVKGWKKSATWSFPRGKINKNEPDLDCAIREVYEETGFNLTDAGLVKNDQEFIDVTMREQHMRLYIFHGVPIGAYFEPRTRKEISKIEWYKLSELPTVKKQKQYQEGRGEDLAVNAIRFYMVAPFMVQLKQWIAKRKKMDKLNGASQPLPAPEADPSGPVAAEGQVSSADTVILSQNDYDSQKLLAKLRQSSQPRLMSDLPEVWEAPVTVQRLGPPEMPSSPTLFSIPPISKHQVRAVPVPSLPQSHAASTGVVPNQSVTNHHHSDSVPLSEPSIDSDGYQSHFDRRMLHPYHPIPGFVPSTVDLPRPKLSTHSSQLLNLFKGVQPSMAEAAALLPTIKPSPDGLQLAKGQPSKGELNGSNDHNSVPKKAMPLMHLPLLSSRDPAWTEKSAPNQSLLRSSRAAKGKSPDQHSPPARASIAILPCPERIQDPTSLFTQKTIITEQTQLSVPNPRSSVETPLAADILRNNQQPDSSRQAAPTQVSARPSPIQPIPSRRHNQHQFKDQKQILLSLFTQSPPLPLSSANVKPVAGDVLSPLSERTFLQQHQRPAAELHITTAVSNIDVVASPTGGKQTPKRATATAPMDRSFLLGYLNEVANEKR